jgi:hypothetical protein
VELMVYLASNLRQATDFAVFVHKPGTKLGKTRTHPFMLR